MVRGRPDHTSRQHTHLPCTLAHTSTRLPSLPAPRCGALDALAEDSVAEEPLPGEIASQLREWLSEAPPPPEKEEEEEQ